MSDAFQQIQAGLADAINHAKGENSHVIEHSSKDINVKAIRENGADSAKFLCNLGDFYQYPTALGTRAIQSQRHGESIIKTG